MLGVAKLQVEFKRDDGGLYPVSVLEVGPAGPNNEPGVCLRFEDSWQPDGWYPIEQAGLFEPPPTRSPEDLADRLRIPCAVETLYRVKQGSPAAWYRGQLVSEAKGLYSIDLQLTPPRRIHQPIEYLRLVHGPAPLTKDSIQGKVFTIPDDLVEEAATEEQLLILSRLGRLDHVQFDPVSKSIVMLVVGPEASHRVDLLFPAHLKYALARRTLRMEIAKMRQDLFPGDESSLHKLEFNVPPERLNASVGYECRNLTRARALPGIVRIVLDDKGHYTVVSKDENSMKEAREILDIGTEIIFVDQHLVGHLIGKKGENVKGIIDATGIFHLGIHDTPESAKRAGVNAEWREKFAVFVVIGLRAGIDAARMLIEYQLDHNRELETHYSAQRGPRPPRGPPRGELSRQATEEHPGSEGAAGSGDNTDRRPRENGPLNGQPPAERRNDRPYNNRYNVGQNSGYAPNDRSGPGGPPRNQNANDNQAGSHNNQERRGSGQNGRPEDQNQNYRGNSRRGGWPRRYGPGGNDGDSQWNARVEGNVNPRGNQDGNVLEEVPASNVKQPVVEPATSSGEMNGHREAPSDEGFTQAGNRKKKSGRNNRGPGAAGPSGAANNPPVGGQ